MIQGLTTSEAQQRLAEVGENALAEKPPTSIVVIFLRQFNNFLTILLLVAAIVSYIIGESVDAYLIFTIVFLNAAFGVYQEQKASDAVKALKHLTLTKIRVVRDGKEMEVDSRFIVPGDVIFIEEGVKIPADAQLVECNNLQVNESALTGESLPIDKKITDEIFMGTVATYGSGYAKITQTGMKTKFGSIALKLSQVETAETPLQQKLNSLTTLIGVIGIVISGLVFVLSIVTGQEYFPSFLLAISLAVAVVPEALPAVMTMTLSFGVNEMAKRKTIVRKLSAIEALGNITLIATDKTGTLTTNKMRVKELWMDDKTFSADQLPKEQSATFQDMLLVSILCSTATLSRTKEDQNKLEVLGDPTEGALLYLARDAGLTVHEVREQWRKVEELPFDSKTKRMLVKAEKDNKVRTFAKGAPESIIEISSLTSDEKAQVEKVLNLWAEKGLRVIALALREESSEDKNLRSENMSDFHFVGMTAIHDPPRPEAREAIEKAKQAGIRTVMVTGDNERTAQAIAASVGLLEEGDIVLTGAKLEEYSEEELLKKLPHVRIFARTTPQHKSYIVSLYQKLGEIVAVTGDGVNDVIALKQANVGIAMGMVGTDVARETADLVIQDDNFATIVTAVEEGRHIIDKLRNAVSYLLTCNVVEAASLLVALIMGIPHLFYPIQLLFVNLVTDGVPALALALSPRQEGVMRRPPETKMTLLKQSDYKYIASVGIVATVIVLAAYFGLAVESEWERQTAAFTVLAWFQSFIFVDVWLHKRSIFKHLHLLVSWIFVLACIIPFASIFVITRVHQLAKIFDVVVLPLPEYFALFILAGFVLVIIKLLRPFIKI